MRKFKQLMLVAALATVLGSVTASPAFATSLKWSSPGEFAIKGTLTLKKGGASAVTCNLSTVGLDWNEAGHAYFGTLGLPWAETKCANGEWFDWVAEGEMQLVGSVLKFNHFTSGPLGATAPWSGRTWSGLSSPTFTNGSGATASHVDFSESEIGKTNLGEKITATGSLSVTTRSGGLLTIIAF